MKNFRNFESAYENLICAENALNSMSSSMANEFAELDFIRKRRQALNSIAVVKMRLVRWLHKNFPRTASEAFASNQFKFAHFFAMLKKYPELAKDNYDSLRSLLYNMQGSSLYTMQIDRVPELEEFI